MAFENRLVTGRWQALKVQHFAGDGGSFVVPLTALPANTADYRAHAFTQNKFETTKPLPPEPTPVPIERKAWSAETATYIPEPTKAQDPVVSANPGIGTVYENGGTIGSPISIIKTGVGVAVLRGGNGGDTIDAGTTISTGTFNISSTASFTASTTAVSSNSFSGTTTLAAGNLTTAARSIDNSFAAPVAIESDIWKFAGNRLFYFNQFRGLQVIDIHDPAHPVKQGTLRLPAVGDQMQLLDPDGRTLALFVRRGSNGWQAEIKIITISDAGVPTVAKNINLDGQLGETRLIGNRLYIVVSGSWWSKNRLVNFHLQGYDLSDPSSPVDLGFAEGTGYTPVIQDSGSYMLVSTTTTDPNPARSGSWLSRTRIHAIDISGDGKPRLVKAATLTGSMQDQFKMSVVNGAIVGVSSIRSEWVRGPSTSVVNGTQTTVSYSYTVYPAQTWVETFSLSGANETPLAQVHLEDAEGENLYAAKFDGQRLYVVTYGVRQKTPLVFDSSYSYTNIHLPCDPLYIIDLNDPAHPVVRGQLEIPGYSTFIQCLGDRLLSVGREGSNVAASLFDVSNADAPKLLSRVFPGSKEGYYSWSESETEHRAVTWLRDQKKFFVPYQSWTGSGYKTATQEVNYTNTKLTLGDIVQTDGTARRGTAINGFLFTISGRELVVAKDSANGNSNAAETASLELAWPVDRIVAVGESLIEIESLGLPSHYEWGWWWQQLQYWSNSCRANKHVTLRLASRADSEIILDSVELAGEQATVIGTTVHGGKLYLAQLVRVNGQDETAELRTYVIKPQGGKLQQVASATTTIQVSEVLKTSSIDYANVQALWVTDNQLVWYVPCAKRVNDYCYRWVYGWQAIPNENPSPEVVEQRHRAAEGWGKPVSALICPVTVSANSISSPVSPLSIIAAPGESRLLSASRAFVDNGWLFFSTAQNVAKDDGEHDEEMERGGDYLSCWCEGYVKNTRLHVLNFNDTVSPEERRMAVLPGPLVGASSADEQGAWLLCMDSLSYSNDPGNTLFSLAYDGALVRRKDKTWTGYGAQMDSRGGLLLKAEYGLAAYRQSQKNGKIQRLASGNLGIYPDTVRIVGRSVLAGNYQSLSVLRINTDHTLTKLASQTWPGYASTAQTQRAVLDPSGAGAWVPVSEYGVEWLPFTAADAIAASGDD